MKITRRRTRRPDPLASATAVNRVLDSLAASLPDLIPRSRKELRAMLEAVRHLYARPTVDAKRGRPSRFPREHLLKVDSALRLILSRETSLSVRSFTGQYLPILDFPRDVREALEGGRINLFEAHQLARLTARHLNTSETDARAQRRRLLDSHLRAQESGAGLRSRVRQLLGEVIEPTATETEVAAVMKADELLEVDPLDSTHLFYEELRRIGRALREIEPEQLTEEDLEALMPALDELSGVLYQIEQRRVQQLKKIKL